MSKEEPKRYSIRIPQEVYVKLVDEAGERKKKHEQNANVNAIIIEILEKHYNINN